MTLVRHGIWCVALLAAAHSASGTEDEQAKYFDSLSGRLTTPLGQTYRHGQLFPLVVELTNTGDEPIPFKAFRSSSLSFRLTITAGRSARDWIHYTNVCEITLLDDPCVNTLGPGDIPEGWQEDISLGYIEGFSIFGGTFSLEIDGKGGLIASAHTTKSRAVDSGVDRKDRMLLIGFYFGATIEPTPHIASIRDYGHSFVIDRVFRDHEARSVMLESGPLYQRSALWACEAVYD